MATLTDLEKIILDELGEDSDSPEVWAGSTDLREAIADGIDELSMFEAFFVQTAMIPLVNNVAFYSVAVDAGYPLWAKRARLWNADRKLDPYSLGEIIAQDRQFLISRGTPIGYVMLSPELLLLYPCNSSTTDVVALDMVCTYSHYAIHNEYVSVRDELEQALVHYGKYHKLMQVKGTQGRALEEYQKFLELTKATIAAKEHSMLLKELRFGEQTPIRR